jgi:CheY-like chemotaxis protein
VLVVEDGEVNQLVAVGMLKSLGHHAVVADNGQQAVAAMREGTFDFVFMDIQMPGMDGYQATREIRRLEDGLRRTPVIAMTATATPDERERCLAAGMDDHVTKPISRAGVAALLEEWVRTPT